MKHTVWSNDKTILELGYRKISWFVSVSQINYLPKNNKSVHDRSRYFAQSRPIFVNYLQRVMGEFTLCKIVLPKYDYGECFAETKWKTWKNGNFEKLLIRSSEDELIRVMVCLEF